MFGFQWHLSDACNRRCRHCYQESFSGQSREVSAAERRRLADNILGSIAEEPVSINLTGGEPLLLPDLLELLAHLETFPNLADVSIITNGTITDPQLLGALKEFPRLECFKISLESGNAEVNDSVRGPGDLEMRRRNIPLYAQATGRPIVLMMTLSLLNFRTIAETVAFARETGTAGIIFERFVPLGTGKGMAETVLTPQAWHNAILDIGKAAGTEVDPDSLAACRAFWLDLKNPGEPEESAKPDEADETDSPLEAALCNLGPNSMALMPDGTVFPCRRLEIPVGNLLHEPFFDVRHRLAAWECPQVRPRLTGEYCGSCPVSDCPGCRALARALTGDPLADDPQCVLRRE